MKNDYRAVKSIVQQLLQFHSTICTASYGGGMEIIMRKRFWKKQWIAIALASSIAVSTVNMPAGQGSFVQAAESENIFYSNDKEYTTEKLTIPEEDWGDNKPIIAYDESIQDINITKNFTMTADIYLDEDGYNSLAEEGDFLKIQGVVKLGDEWVWNDSQDIPYLEQKNFEITGQVYKTSITIEFTDKDADVLKGVYFVIVAQGFEGIVTFANVKLTEKQEQQVTETKEPLVVDNFDESEAGTNAGWEKEDGWQYDNDVTVEVTEISGNNMLKLGLDYTGFEGYNWSEAKVKKNFENGLDVSAYNLLEFEIIYPEEFDGKFKTKVFSQGDGTGIIDKEGVSVSSSFGDGMKKAVVTVSFSPNAEKITDITLGIVGVNTSFKGNVYIDNITLSQYDETSDFVDITSVPGEGSGADISGMTEQISLADKDAINSAKALYSYLFALQEAGQVLFGHQNDTHKHVTSREDVYSDTKDITGSISGIAGIDSLALTGVESGITDTDEAIAECIRIGKEAASEGAILTLSLHMPNMSNDTIKATPDAKRKYDFSQCNFMESQDLSNNCAQEVMPGGKYNAQFTTYLDIIADYAKGLGEIPVLFRPFHENNGGWFWWGSSSTSKETYKAMYRYMKDYLNAAGVHNLIYVYSPNGPIESETEYNERYPGDDYVDILAFDYYDDIDASSTYNDSFFNSLRSSCEVVKRLADSKGKIAAIAETGVRVTREGSSEGIMVKDNPIKDKKWYSNVNKVAKETGMPYFLLWANFSDTNFYIPYKYNETKGQELVNEFIDFYNEESSIFANGTNFYGKADQKQVTNIDQKVKSGYFINIFSMAEIKDAVTLKAVVKNASDVKFVLNSGSVKKELPALLNPDTSYYEAELSKDDLDALGKTDTGTISIDADNENIVVLPNISFGKGKPVLESHQADDFETYAGDNGLLSSKWNTNKASGCKLDISLVEEPCYEGNYALKFAYTETKGGWAGATIAKDADWSMYNALSFWVQPDGKNQKTVVQITAGGIDYEVYLQEYSDYANASTPLLVTLPFSEFKAKGGSVALDTEALKNVGRFGLWVNAIDDSEAFANGEETVSGILYYDDIKAVSADTSVPVFEKIITKPGEPVTTPVPTKQPAWPSYPIYSATPQPQGGGSQMPDTTQTPAASQTPGVTQTPVPSQTPGTTQEPASSHIPDTTTEVKKDDITGTVTEITTTKDNNLTIVTEKTTLADGTQNIKETVTENLNGIMTIKETSSSNKTNVVLVKNITKYIEGDVISVDAVLYTGNSEIVSDYSAKNTIPESFLNEAKEAGINSVTFCIGNNIVDDVKSNKNHRMVIKVEVPQSDGVSVGKVLLSGEAVQSAVEGGRKLVVKMLNENPADSYTVTIPPSELGKMQGDIDISIKAGNVAEISGNKQKKIESILSANNIKPENAAIVSIASNNTEGGIKASVPVVNSSIKAGSKVYVYRYNSKTGKLEEIANSKRTVLKNGMTGIEGYSGNDYVVTSKELSGKNVVTLLSQSKVKFSKTSVKKGGKIKINITLPEELKAETSLKKEVPYAKQATVVQYKSSDSKVAKISKDGTIKAVSKGKAVITVQIKLTDSKVKTVKKKITVK